MRILLSFAMFSVLVSGCAIPSEEAPSLESWDTHVRSLNDVLVNQGDLDRIPEFISDTYTVYTADTSYSGPQLVYSFISNLRAAFPDLVVETHVLSVDGDMISWVRKHTGTHLGEFMGFEPTGKEYQWQSVVITRYQNGLAQDEWGASSLISQLANQ